MGRQGTEGNGRGIKERGEGQEGEGRKKKIRKDEMG